MENREWRMENGKRDGRRSKTLRRSLSYGVAGEDEGRAGGGREGEWARGRMGERARLRSSDNANAPVLR